ncbi:MAG TPA: carboxypeptidase-like regulatory domain-containing protein, partial [Bacteroidales bacterium]|nr:carboxypeptidase-like regulatory domain-containing protein [Bacteroidales bacterium]
MRKLFFFLGFYILSITLYAQNLQISGKVTDVEGQPLPGVNILEKGTQNGTITSADGIYSI